MTFVVGDSVRVSGRRHPGHHRTPGYLKDRRGTVERVHATFRNPETRAYGHDGLPEVRLYLVRVEAEQIAGADGTRQGDQFLVDVFEHWLEPDA